MRIMISSKIFHNRKNYLTLSELLSMRNNIWRAVLSGMFALMALWGYQINATDSVSYGNHPILFVVLTVVFFFVIFLIDYIMKILEKAHMSVITDRFMIFSGLIILCVWIVTWLALFPGLAIYDGPSQLAQWNKGTISTHHPYIHSAFLGFCDTLAKETGIEDYSFFNSIIQMIFQFICYMRLLYTLRELKTKMAYMVYIVFFMAFYPPNAFMALTTSKDTIFSGFFILMMCELIMFIKKRPEDVKKWDLARLIIFSAFMCIFRNNGVYAFAVGFPFLIFVGFKKLWKKLALVYMCVLSLSILFSSFVTNVMNIRGGDSREALNVIIQPLSRIYNSVPGELSSEESERIRNLFFGNEVVQYVSYCSDSSKIIFDTYFFRSEIRDNLNLYFSLMKRYPTAYIDAFLATNLGNYYPLESLPRNFKVYYEIPIEDNGHSLIPGLYDIIANFAWNSSYRNSKLITIWLSSGVTLWKLLYVMYYMVRRREYDKLTVCAIPLLLIGTMFLGPVALIRYTQPITITIPILMMLAMFNIENNDKTQL